MFCAGEVSVMVSLLDIMLSFACNSYVMRMLCGSREHYTDPSFFVDIAELYALDFLSLTRTDHNSFGYRIYIFVW